MQPSSAIHFDNSAAVMHTGRTLCSAALAISVVACASQRAFADEGGVGFWLPGMFGSLAATPTQPGWAWTTLYYHTQVEAGANVALKRGATLAAGIRGQGDLVAFGPTYVFAQPFLGAQASVSLLGIGGRNVGTISATLTGPLGNSIAGARSDSVTGFGDIIPQATLKWNYGVHNLMVYATGDMPAGAYDPNRLANLGIGHWAFDGGGGYTYFDPKTGHEFSAVTGFTYNFKNPYTDYQNGIDWHFDWGLSQFISKQVHIGAVGYFYQQITGDSGSGATLGDYKSRVAGVGPQIGYLFPVGDMQGYLNMKAYFEFDAQNRPDGWNLWLAFAVSPSPREQLRRPGNRN